MNGIFGAGPADLNYEDQLQDPASQQAWQPTFSSEAIARQWGLPAQSQQPAFPVLPPAPQIQMSMAPAASAPRNGAATKPAQAGITIPGWLPWMLAIAALGAVVYVVSKKPETTPETV